MEKELSKEAKLIASIVGGKIELKAVYDGVQMDADIIIRTNSDLLVDALLALIPGDSAFEQSAGALLKSALKTISA